ncbi:Wzz/FepE/Etk N-terminal domain-containing protein [Pseudidiomarina insulisalsae]|uniref:Polysaccharide chain length determinant N-terminal domain-containing protein n=1 Tax=Pseudidiomarina insulisalsae TaxID=575789 RepID=A0A432YNN7_9GAMM|nr:Wzz/FepE/Etk N-terminal domain-containing protein [Pseudidiomarina insulisalsae]RUO62611.1 hypothetical protein CWI71_04040 [Pseudidiomarina insulisalsae]
MKTAQRPDDVIHLSKFFALLWQRKFLIVLTAFIVGGAAYAYSLTLPNIYRTEVITIVPNSQSGPSLPNMGGSLGGLMGLANLGGGDSAKLRLEQVEELIKSRAFLHNFIEKYQLKADLYAAIDWQEESNTIVYDTELYNPETQTWVVREPTPWQLYGRFLEAMKVTILFNKNMLKLNIDHVSPHVAQNWATWLIDELNTFYKLRSAEEAKESIRYLENAVTETEFIFLRDVFSTLLEEQIKKDMLVEVKAEYAFETLAPAVLPESKSHPKRTVIGILGVIIGGLLGIILASVLGLRDRLKRD